MSALAELIEQTRLGETKTRIVAVDSTDAIAVES